MEVGEKGGFMESLPAVLLVATMDTKGSEAAYVMECLGEAGIAVVSLDGGIMGESPIPTTISREEVARAGGKTLDEVRAIGHEGKALAVMIEGAKKHVMDLYGRYEIKGVFSLGGSMGTTLGTSIMRTLPIGFPKVMVSTMASRDTHDFVGTKDIAMFNSVCDLAGINRISQKVLRNGALALAGMVKGLRDFVPSEKRLTMLSTLGTTEICAQQIRKLLENKGKEVMFFHTNGSGGKAMEELAQVEDVEVVIDLSLHELMAHRLGGGYDAGPARGTGALIKGIPTVLVPGNIDFLATGPLEATKRDFPGRIYHSHNAAITAVNTTVEEARDFARFLGQRCGEAKGPLAVLVPMGGLSAFSSRGGPFYNEEVPRAFAEAIKEGLSNEIPLRTFPYHINDREFSEAVVAMTEEVLTLRRK